MTTMANLRKLLPCASCDARMAVPGSSSCTTCEAELSLWNEEIEK